MRLIAAVLVILGLSGPALAADSALNDLIWSGKNDQAIQAMQNDPTLITAKVDGYTPLHLASMVGNTEVAKFLLDNGADVNARDAEGYSPLVRAKANGNDEIAKMLTDHGAKELRP
ncbi:ankyrin repeat domain-containing protein [Stappia indica]|uniref:ankyrin repeat domain-containing protein n=1 Tax=Stappia indica TaxID=538381 RepID=UPI001CD27300|nr:ankyrin repeat domain-containing protein [Stappia indica]MCA1299457.1 ankyrin repeat domain-containing protein [Stappia indica]